MQKDKICCIVDAYSVGTLLAPEFAAKGFKSVHVQSRPNLCELYQKKFRKDDFIANILFDGDLETLVNQLKKYNLSFLLAGSEFGVELADQLRHRLNLFPNDISVTKTRRNKYEMIEQLRTNGLNATEQIKSTKLNEVLDWVLSRNDWPVVLKPLECAGTVDVYVCHNKEEVVEAFTNIYNKVNFIGILNDAVLAQAFLRGDEYIVNTVSWEGRHYLSDIWHIAKKEIPGAGRMYSYSELLAPEGEIQNVLTKYIFKVLDALKISFGPAHNEIMLTEKGPFLIEMGARLDGCNLYTNKKYVKCIEANQLQLTVEAYTAPDLFLKRMEKKNKFYKFALEIYLNSNKKGLLKGYSRLERIESLPSFWELQLRINPGEKIEETKDLLTLSGIVWLAHEDKEVLFDDYRKLREIEREGIYIIESESSCH